MNTTIKRGALIVFEGADGVGKSSISKDVATRIEESGRSTLHYAFPGSEEKTVGKLVYEVHHDKKSYQNISKTSLQALHIAAHIDAIHRKIIPALDSGVTVILDRFWWSTYVYGIVDNVDALVLKALIKAERLVWGDTKPDVAFLIDRDSPLRKEPLEKWTLWRQHYLKIVQEESHHYATAVIQNQGSQKETSDSIYKELVDVI